MPVDARRAVLALNELVLQGLACDLPVQAWRANTLTRSGVETNDSRTISKRSGSWCSNWFEPRGALDP